MSDTFEPSVNEMMKRALAVPLVGCEIRPPRLTAPRLAVVRENRTTEIETGLDREFRERQEEIGRLERMLD